MNVGPDEEGTWTARIEAVHAFPLMDEEGRVTGWERRTYDDTVVLRSSGRTAEEGTRRRESLPRKGRELLPVP